jgi:hypothetical protein
MDGPIRQQLRLLLSAYGYNLYDKKNRARADDLLVREKAAAALAAAAGTLGTLRTEYRRRFIPPPTRDNPEPPRERLESLRELAAVQERLASLEARIRSTPVPTQDHAWERFRREQTLLDELLTHDYNLIAPSQELRDRVRALTPDTWDAAAAGELRRMADGIEQALHARAELLSAPV